LRFRRKRRTRPRDRMSRRLVHEAGALLDGLVVVALDDEGPVHREARDDRDHLRGVRAVADEVAQERVALRTRLARVPQACLQRLEVAVNIGKKSDLQEYLPRPSSRDEAGASPPAPDALRRIRRVLTAPASADRGSRDSPGSTRPG